MEMAVKSMKMAVESMESMEMALGAIPVLAGCQNRDFCPPKLVFNGGGTMELYLGKCRLI
jgi:hypothetical protein